MEARETAGLENEYCQVPCGSEGEKCGIARRKDPLCSTLARFRTDPKMSHILWTGAILGESGQRARRGEQTIGGGEVIDAYICFGDVLYEERHGDPRRRNVVPLDRIDPRTRRRSF